MTKGESGDDFEAAREAALRLLARREHSVVELAAKLAQRGWDAGTVDPVLTELAEAGLQSDRRFAEAFARQRAGRSYGPRRIRAELKARGIDTGLTEQAMESLEIDFREQARQFYRHKYGEGAPEEFRERVRRSQALYRRGFEPEHFRALLDQN